MAVYSLIWNLMPYFGYAVQVGIPSVNGTKVS